MEETEDGEEAITMVVLQNSKAKTGGRGAGCWGRHNNTRYVRFRMEGKSVEIVVMKNKREKEQTTPGKGERIHPPYDVPSIVSGRSRARKEEADASAERAKDKRVLCGKSVCGGGQGTENS